MVKYELSRGLNKSEEVRMNVTFLLHNVITGMSCDRLIIQDWIGAKHRQR